MQSCSSLAREVSSWRDAKHGYVWLNFFFPCLKVDHFKLYCRRVSYLVVFVISVPDRFNVHSYRSNCKESHYVLRRNLSCTVKRCHRRRSNVKPRRNNMKRLLKSRSKQQHEAKKTNVTNWTQHTHVYQRCKRTRVVEQSALQGTSVKAISAHRNCAAWCIHHSQLP